MSAAAAAVVGAVLGALLRNAVDTDRHFWRSALIGVLGGLLLGVGIGWVSAVSPPPPVAAMLAAGLGSAMLTFCVCTPAAVAVVRGERGRVGIATVLAGLGIAAGMAGAGIGVVAA